MKIKATKKEMLLSAGKVAKRVIMNEIRRRDSLVSDSRYHLRMAMCRGCAEYRTEDGRCMECGCAMNLKTKFKFASCPIGKWNSEEQE